jgi:hypothetical protein
MRAELASFLEKVCSGKYPELACLCPEEPWASAMILFSEFSDEEREVIRKELCNLYCTPKA